MNRKNLTVKEHVSQLKPIKNVGHDVYTTSRTNGSEGLLEIFNSLASNFPSKKKVKVLSLGCGVPDEYIALRVFCNARGIDLDYTGIDIDGATNADVTASFSVYSDSFRVITCDGSSVSEVMKALADAKCLPEDGCGFDTIFLRHPAILCPERKKIFLQMLIDVIPFIADSNARIFISCYYESELKTIDYITRNSKLYFKPSNDYRNFVRASNLTDEYQVPESFCIILKCKGFAFNVSVAVEYKKSPYYMGLKGLMDMKPLTSVTPRRPVSDSSILGAAGKIGAGVGVIAGAAVTGVLPGVVLFGLFGLAGGTCVDRLSAKCRRSSAPAANHSGKTLKRA